MIVPVDLGLRGRRALITGGSRGIGLAVAEVGWRGRQPLPPHPGLAEVAMARPP